VIPLIVDTVIVDDKNTVSVTFNKSINQTIVQTLTNYSIDGGIGNPSAVTLGTDGKSAILTFATDFADADYNLSFSNLEDLDGNVISTSGYDFSYLNLAVTSVTQSGELGAIVTFNQEVNQTSAETLANYSLTEIGTPTSATLSSTDARQVTISWDKLYNSSYALTVSDIANSVSNSTLTSESKELTISKVSSYGQLLINEMMADPSPVVGLPDAEFVEVYNPNDFGLNLKGFTLNGKTLSSYQLGAKAYVLICAKSDSTIFGLTNSIALSSFDALTNTGETVYLRDQFNNLIDTISYGLSWYGNTDKDDGGYSLERIDPLQPCNDATNWGASSDATGGTPGRQNSIFNNLDTTPPELVSLTVKGNDSLRLTFSEPLDQDIFTISSASLAANTFATLTSISFTGYWLILTEDLVSEQSHTLTLTDVKDCRGNVNPSQSWQLYHDTKAPVFQEIVVLSSTQIALIFDEPLNESLAEDEDNFDQDGAEIERALLQDSAFYRIHLTLLTPMIEGTTYTFALANLEDTLGNVMAPLTRDLTFASQVKSIKVIAANILEVQFTEVPRMGDLVISNFQLGSGVKPTQVVQKQGDQSSIRLSFAKNFTENSSLFLYMQNLKSASDGLAMSTPAASFIYDTRAPFIEQVTVIDSVTIEVLWNESLDTLSAVTSSFYTLENDEQPIKIEIDQAETYSLTFKNLFAVEATKTLSVKGVKDLSDNIVTTTRRATFVYDTLAPILSSAQKISATDVELNFHEKIKLASVENLGHYLLGGVQPTNSELIGPDSTKVILTFGTISESSELALRVTGIEDFYQNTIDTVSVDLDTFNPSIVELSADNDSTLQVSFSHAMSANAFDKSNYTISGFTVSTVSKIDDYKVQLILAEKLSEGIALSLLAQGITAENGQSLIQDDKETTFLTFLSKSEILDNETILLQFNTTFESVGSVGFTVSSDNEVLFAAIDGKEQGWIRVTLQDQIPENEPFRFAWNGLKDKFGRKLPNFYSVLNYDTEKPKPVSIQSDFFGQIDLSFSEEMDASATSISKYDILGIGNPDKALLTSTAIVRLDFADKLTSGDSYDLVVRSLSDIAGNFSSLDTITFTYNSPLVPKFGEVVFSELMPDPSPSIGLPEVEYIELYNITEKDFDLRGLKLSDGTKDYQLPRHELKAGSYVALVAQSNRSLFTQTNVIGLGSIPSLTNTSDQLYLKNILGNLINEVAYDISWYQDTNKDDGGYSLELIDPSSDCPISINWKASSSEIGGTPGLQNSVFRSGPDSDIPQLKSSNLINSTELELTFSEVMDSTSLINLQLVLDGNSAKRTRVSDLEFTKSVITLTNALTNGETYTITISGAKDCSGNPMEAKIITLTLGKEPTVGDLIITEIMADPEPLVGLPNSEYIEIYNTSDVALNLSNVLLRDATTSRKLSATTIKAKSYLILCPSASANAFSVFGEALGLANWPSLTNSGEEISISTTVTLDKVTYSDVWYGSQEKKDGGYSLELINPTSDCPSSANWSASIDLSGGTPGRVNSIYSLNPDSEAPSLLMSEVINDQLLKFTFSETMDSVLLANATISGAGTIATRSVNSKLTELNVSLQTALPKGQDIAITISGAADCSGNVMEPATFNVGFGDKPVFNEIIITEIMADPDPVFGLPNSEYLELYNASDRLISLDGLQLSDATGNTALPAVSFAAGEYLLLLPTSSLASYIFVPNKAGVAGWLSLNNTGENLFIMNGNELIYSIIYDDSWYGNQAPDGGYSLEMRDVTNPCGGAINWGVSTSAEGGTPGVVNSIRTQIPDNFGPSLLGAIVKDKQSVALIFDEPLDADSEDLIAISFEPSLQQTGGTLSSDRTEYTVILNEELAVNVVYAVTVGGITDCVGNIIRGTTGSFVRPDEVDSLDIILNEILFNPKTGGVDFVELYNLSDKYFDLLGWSLGRQEDELQRTYFKSSYLVRPHEYVVITSDTSILKGYYPRTASGTLFQNSLPSMPNDQATVVLSDLSDRQMDVFTYNEDFHLSLLKSVEGVSLERISPSAMTDDPNNWKSASSSVGFATPGYTNSQNFESPVSNAVLQIEPKVFLPQSSNPAFQSFTTINYQFDDGGQFANVTVYNQMGQPIAQLAKGASLGTSGFLRWDGTTDSGAKARMGYYVVFFEVYDSKGNQQVLKETVVIGR
jgi:hypothetical protein